MKLFSNFSKYFLLNKWQSILFVSLVSISALLAVVNYSLPYIYQGAEETKIDSIALQKLTAAIHADTSKQSSFYTNKNDRPPHIMKPFAFNPNTCSKEQWINMGFSEQQTNTILNYKNKGGQFRTKYDVEKMYSISEDEYKQIKAYIQLPEKNDYAEGNKNNFYTEKKTIVVEINSADTAAWNSLSGIGSAFAKRIVDYRNELGGFYSKEQIKEVYGISEELYNKILPQLQCNTSRIKKINLNSVLFQELQLHPYAKNGLALALLKYRKSVGNKISSVQELYLIEGINTTQLKKLEPYLGLP
jgi:competence protein ComEA